MSELMLEVGGRRADGAADGYLWIAKDGLDGWWDTGETLFQEETQEDEDGAFDPVEVTVGPKRVNVTLLADASSPHWAEHNIRSWAASLVKMVDLGFRVHVEGSWLSLRKAKVRGAVKVRPNRKDMRLTEIIFTVWSADPRRYGPLKELPVEAVQTATGGLAFPIVDGSLDFGDAGTTEFPGVFRITNPGTAELYPIFSVEGPMDAFTITSEDYVIAYDAPLGPDDVLVMSPYAGGRAELNGVDVSPNLTRADWVPVRGGETRGYILEPTNPGAGSRLIATYNDGAFW